MQHASMEIRLVPSRQTYQSQSRLRDGLCHLQPLIAQGMATGQIWEGRAFHEASPRCTCSSKNLPRHFTVIPGSNVAEHDLVLQKLLDICRTKIGL
jgi:hypothetical protein